jgi:hypothetical protein
MTDAIFSSVLLGIHPASKNFFSRLDERDDAIFYSKEMNGILSVHVQSGQGQMHTNSGAKPQSAQGKHY